MIQRLKQVGNGIRSAGKTVVFGVLVAAAAVVAYNALVPSIAKAEEPQLRLKSETSWSEMTDQPNQYSLMSFGDKEFKVGTIFIHGEDSNGKNTDLLRIGSRFPWQEILGKTIDVTVLGEGSKVGGKEHEGAKIRLDTDLGAGFHLGYVQTRTADATDIHRMADAYARFEHENFVLGTSYADLDGVVDIGYFGLVHLRGVPLLQEFLVSAGTSGLGNDNYAVTARLPSIKVGEEVVRDFGAEAFVVFDNEEILKYTVRVAAGNARMSAGGNRNYVLGSAARVAGIDGVDSGVNEFDLLDFLLPLRLEERGTYGVELSGKEKPLIEVTCNPNIAGNWFGGRYDTQEDVFAVEGGVNIRGLQLDAIIDTKGNSSIRVETNLFN